MCGMRHLILLTFLTWPLTDASGNGGSCQSEDPSKAPSLLSLKADVLKAVYGMENENREHSLNGTVCSNCSNSTNSTNHSLEDLIKTVLEDDINQSNGMPDPVDADGTGGSLGKNLEFLYLKVAQLETAVELQSIELRFGRQELHQAQLEIQTLKDRLDHKDAALKQINSKLAKFQGEEPEPKLENKHRAAWLKQMEKNQKSKEEVGRRTQDLLMAVIKKHHRQTQRRWGTQETPASKAQKAPKGETKAELNEVMAQRAQSQHGATSDLDRSVASKGVPIVDDIVDAGEDMVDLVTDGTDLVGDALSDAYNQAADKVEFVANTVIDTVEQAVAILSQGFDFSANCPNWSGPSLSVSDSGLSVDWGRQRCRVTLVGQTLTLFDMNFGSTSVAYPAPLTAMISVGQQVSGCLSNGNALDVFKCTAKAIGDELLADVPAFKILFALAEHVAGCTGDALDVFACTAAKVGDVLLQKVPPFSILMNLGTMISEFVAFFAELASALIHTLLSETASLMQEAVNTSFPGVGEKPLQLAGPKGLTAHVRRQRGQQTPNRANKGSASKPSFLQRDANRKPSNDVDNGIVGFGTTEAQPYASMLITQFGGDEYDSGSCLAFAPSHRTGRTGNVTMRDWQVPSPDSDDFVKLEPWAVPCDNQWAKDNPSKWEGYSFYTYESVIEKCAAITYSMSAQPVMAFVGGLEFDLLPAPLMEITTEVCWPDRVSAPDLSLIVFTARSAGIVLFTHTIRLHRRFGSDTNFTSGNFKDSVERPRNYFGKGTGDDDDKALQVLSRTVEAQPTTVLKPALSQTNATEGPHHKPTRQSSPEEFEVKQQELFLASAKYDHRLGLNITARYEGAAAAKRVQAALSKKLSALQQDAGDLGVHELFELASPSGSLVGFSIKGELASGYLQLRVRMNFGPAESPTKTIRLIDLVDNLRVVLAALPYVSQASKQKAIDAMSNTHFDSELPAAEFVGRLTLESGVSQASGRVRDAVFERKDGICSVQAALKPTTWGTLATLPKDCRPSETLVFNLMTQDASMPASVEVNANGVVKWVEGSSDSWLSLSGLVFPALSPGWPIELSNGWSNAAAPYAGATYTLVGSLCFVEGRIVSGSTWGVLAQLSAGCRPTKTLAFNLNVEGSATSQIEVHINGEVVYSAGPQVGWVSLSGIVFATATHAQKSLDLADGWVATSGGDFGVPTYSLTHGYCLVEGRVDGTLVSGGGTLATLPVECWPMRKLIFSKAHGTTTMEVDVSEFGEISYSTDSDSGAATVSLSGIMFTAPSDGLRLLPAVTPWTASIGGQWGEGVFVMKNGFCMVNARPQGGSFTSLTIIANLPEGCRPTKRLTFNLNHHDYTHSVDVTPDGSVVWMAGTGKYTWVSLTGITFAPGDLGRITLPLLNGWSAYGLEYGIPEVTKRNGICSVEGRLTGSSWSNLAQLPEDCTPSKRLIFNMNNLEQTSRVDVRDDGVIKWVAGGNSYNWISLAGMIIVPDESNAVPLELQNNWAHYGSSYGTATYVLVDGICVIQGMVKNGAKGTVVAVLPAECRPRERLTFNMNLKQSVARVDVLTSGSIRFQASGSWTTTWLSLSGIHFPI